MVQNHLTKLGVKYYRGLKSFLTDFYSPTHQTIRGLHRGATWVDHMLQNANDYGIPASAVGVVKDNPIYASIMGAINYATDVDRDIMRYTDLANTVVEQGIIGGRAPARMGGLNYGMTPNRMPSARQFVPQNSASS